MLHTEVTTLVTRFRAAVAEAANRGKLPRRIQFRGNLEFVADPPPQASRQRMAGRMAEKWRNCKSWPRDSRVASMRRSFARIWKRMRIVVSAYEVIIPRCQIVKSTDEGKPSKCQVRSRYIFSLILTGKISSARYEYKKIEIADITELAKIKQYVGHV